MRVLVDTNVISYVLREREPFFSRFTEALETENVFVSSDVVDYEIRRYLVLKDAKRQLARYEALSRDWLPVSLTRDDWRTAATVDRNPGEPAMESSGRTRVCPEHGPFQRPARRYRSQRGSSRS